ncbi:MAG: Wzz/FepE/Etk N-terminal domain-containing protein [Chloroflexi bacterium]|nr:Wzz/FepE/Etk N-terminal domain-containing protein [Chloroflexota bacterium]
MSNMENEIEIDLQKYVRALIRSWKILIGVPILFAVAAYLVFSFFPVKYETTAMVAVTQSRYVYNFDPRVTSTENILPNYKAYPVLAMSDDILSNLLIQWKNKPAGISTPDDLRKILSANLGADPSLVNLTVQYKDPKVAADLANLWASIFIPNARGTFSGQGENQVQFFGDQLAQSKTELDKAEKALVDFQSTNQVQILTNELNSLLQSQTEYLARKRNLQYLDQDIQALNEQLGTQSAASQASLASQISLINLQNRAFNSGVSIVDSSQTGGLGTSNSINSTPIQLQINNVQDLANSTVGDQIAFLNQLEKTLQAQSEEIDTQLKNLAPQIFDLQTKKQQMQTTLDNLTRTRDVANETYTTMARQVDQSRISAQGSDGEVQLAAKAIAPTIPVSQHKARNAVIAAVLGGVLVMIAVIVLEWYKGFKPSLSTKPVNEAGS